MNLAAALAMRGQTLRIDLDPKPTAVSRSWTTARSIAACNEAIADPACELAQIIQPAATLLIPIQSSYFALEGTDDLLEAIEKVRSLPPWRDSGNKSKEGRTP